MRSSDLYLLVREKEGRLYPDDVVARLPEVPAGHALSNEWRARTASLDRLTRYIADWGRPIRLLELGCGNGWLSHRLSVLPGLQVWGLDRLGKELDQAARLFNGAHLVFLAADVFQPPFTDGTFDIIIVASVIQYFPDLPQLVRCLRQLLSERGELHILDSPLYDARDLAAARERTRAYYTALGVPEMAVNYFHHTFADLREFSPQWLHRPESIRARLSRFLHRVDSPFAWLCIR
jgi:ubiquinone/menaquinone biosynthesis C-methylase UbiE